MITDAPATAGTGRSFARLNVEPANRITDLVSDLAVRQRERADEQRKEIARVHGGDFLFLILMVAMRRLNGGNLPSCRDLSIGSPGPHGGDPVQPACGPPDTAGRQGACVPAVGPEPGPGVGVRRASWLFGTADLMPQPARLPLERAK